MADQGHVVTAGPPAPRRVFVRDIKPYEVPESLSALRGPAGEVLFLSHSVLWTPAAAAAGGGRVDVDVPGGAALAYAAVISEGTVAEQVEVINAVRLVEVGQPAAAASCSDTVGVPLPRAGRPSRLVTVASETLLGRARMRTCRSVVDVTCTSHRVLRSGRTGLGA